MNVWDLAYVLFKHKWRILLYTIGLITALVLFCFLWPPTFQSTSRFLLQKSTSTFVDPTIFTQHSTQIVRSVSGNEEANNERQIALSRAVLEAVVREKLGLSEPYQPAPPQGLLATIQQGIRDAITWLKSLPRRTLEVLGIIGPKPAAKKFDSAVTKLEQKLEVRQIADSDVLEIAYEGWYPEHLQAVVASAAKHYLAQHVEVHQNVRAGDFYTDQLDAARARLEEAEAALAGYRAENGIIDIDKSEFNWLEKVEIHERALLHLDKEVRAGRARLALVRGQMDRGEAPIVPSPEIDKRKSVIALREVLIKKQLELASNLEKYTPDHPAVRQNQLEVEEVERALRQEVERVIALMEQQLTEFEVEAAATRSNLDRLYRETGRDLPLHRQRIAQLERAIEDAQAVYEEIAKRRADTGMKLARDERMVKLSQLEGATRPLSPVWPDLFLFVLVGFPLAPIVSISVAFLVEGLRSSFRREEDVKAALPGVPLLAVLDHARTEAALRAGSREAVQRIATALADRPAGAPPLVLFCEPAGDEGAATVAALVAEHLAQGGKRVLLLAARGTASAASVPGLTVSDALAPTQLRTLPTRGESERRLAPALREVDLAIADAPPLATSALTEALARLGPDAVLVVRAERTGAALAVQSVERLRAAGAAVVGTVLTDRRRYVPASFEARL